MAQVKLKVCGITTLEDALLAIECGADYIGFNFFKPSPRYVSPDVVRAIVNQVEGRVIPVGVFVNESLADIREVVELSGVRMTQLHGDEDRAFCETLGSEGLIKVVRPGPDFEPASVFSFPAAAILVDTPDARLYGGTGRTADWTIASEVAVLRPTFLAGGIGPANVREAIAQVAPFAIDVNSAVETGPGKKDRTKLEKLRMEMSS